MNDFADVIGAFFNPSKTVINWEGENFYRACGSFVVEHSDGTRTSCVKRVDHPGDVHEDFDGVLRRATDFETDEPREAGFDEDKVGAMPGDMYAEKVDGPNDFIKRRLAWEHAKELVDFIVDKFGLEDYVTRPSGFSIGYTTTNTKVDQYFAHVENLADWLLGIED